MNEQAGSQRISSPQDLLKLRDAARGQVDLRGGPKESRAVVHMGTCGIAAGARDVVAELAAELDTHGVQTVTVRQSGCIGLCDQEPMFTYTDKSGRNFLYVKLTREKVREIVASHFVKGAAVEKYILKGDSK
jgi:NADP-reducing hydrogenase subunit HndB